MTDADARQEVERLREALKPFAMEALSREARDAPDDRVIQVTLGMCRRAQKAMAAD